MYRLTRGPAQTTRRTPHRATLAALGVAVLALTVLTPANAGAAPAGDAVVDQQVRDQVWAGAATFFVYLREQAEVGTAAGIGDRAARRTAVYQRLTTTADRTQAGLRSMLAARGVGYDSYWIANALRVTGDATLLDAIAKRPEVLRIEPERTYRIVEPVPASTEPGITAIEWNINNIQAPRVWSEIGVRGEGVVVANIDTGVRFNHAALVNQYRGNRGGGSFDHNYNWFDPAKVCGNPSTAPCDNNNHGTHTMGTILGDDGGTNQIGVAPGARWMAAKGCETGSCSSDSLLKSGQWVIAPTDLNGQNPRPDLGADVVSNSWGGGRGDTWYQQTIRNWIAAGTFPVFSQGNSGPNCGTANSPGDNPEAYGVGAYDINNAIANFSSRGPSPLNNEIKPNIAAPGVNVRSSVANGGYSSFSGTSMAAPHVAGTVALIWSASAAIRGDVPATRGLLDQSAVDVNSTGCGGTAAKNNNFGEGRLDAFAAASAAPRGPTGTLTGRVTNASTGAAISGAVVRVAPSDRSTTTDSDGRYTLRLPEGTYDVTASHGRFESKTATGVVVRVDQTTTQNFALTPLPTGTLTGTVTDATTGAAISGATVTASGPETASATTDNSGRYTLTLAAGTYTVTGSAPLYRSLTVTGVVVNANQTTTRNLALAQAFGTITGVVTRASNGAVIAGATVQLFGGPGGSFRTTTDASGRYTITKVASGTYTMFVTASGCFLSSTQPTIRDGQTTVHNVVLNCFS